MRYLFYVAFLWHICFAVAEDSRAMRSSSAERCLVMEAAPLRWPFCLNDEIPRPISSTEPDIPQSMFLSFEEWKARNFAKNERDDTTSGEHLHLTPDLGSSITSATSSVVQTTTMTESPARTIPSVSENHHSSSTNERMLTDEIKKERFNHASYDCAASVVLTNQEAKGAANILKNNKDQYMLNACGAATKFVVVELCNDILVDTIQLANYEYFSGVFRNVSVEVSAKFPPGKDGWQQLGNFRARHTRETQTFTFSDPILWARYVKITMLSFYGSEFYCPLSMIRVFGKTMMEDYKADSLDRDTGEPDVTIEQAAPGELLYNITAPIPTLELDQFTSALEAAQPTITSITSTPEPRHIEVEIIRSTSVATNVADVVTASTAFVTAPVCAASTKGPKITYATNAANLTIASKDTLSAADSPPSQPVNSAEPYRVQSTLTNIDRLKHRPSPTPSSQESIYKQIAKRLALLEVNASLSLQYIEAQSASLAASFTHLSSTQTRLLTEFLQGVNSTLTMRISSLRSEYEVIQRETLRDWDASWKRQDADVRQLKRHLRNIQSDMQFFRRLGIFQSILVVILMVFVFTTRNSVIDIPKDAKIRSNSSYEDLAIRRALSPRLWREKFRSVSLVNSPHQDSYDSPYSFPVTQISRPQARYPGSERGLGLVQHYSEQQESRASSVSLSPEGSTPPRGESLEPEPLRGSKDDIETELSAIIKRRLYDHRPSMHAHNASTGSTIFYDSDHENS